MKNRRRTWYGAVAILLVVSMVIADFAGFSFTTEAATDTSTQNTVAEGPIALATETWDFESDTQEADFAFYKSGDSNFSIKDGMLIPSGANGEMKAISKSNIQDIKSVSVDIIPGESGLINVGLYIGASNVGNEDSSIDALAFLVESNFSGWSDAPNRIDVVTGKFPTWTEYKRLISESGRSNALYKNGVKEPLNLRLDFEEDMITVTLSLVSNSAKYVQTVYECAPADLVGSVGIRALNSDVCFDNFKIGYDRAVPEKLQQGLKFEGGNQATAKLNQAVTTIPQTIEMWVKIDKDTTAGRVALFSSFTGSTVSASQKGDFALFTDGSGKLWWFERTENGTFSSAKGSSIKTGEWMHVAITRSEGNVKYYINGNQEASVDSANVVLNTASSTIPTLGYCSYGGNNFLDGTIGDVRLWSTTRTPAEIQEDMFTELNGNETGLMNNWTLDEQAGTVFWDKASSGNNGTIKTSVVNDNSETVAGATWTAVSVLNEGLEFATIGAKAQLSKATGTIPQTVEAWVKIDTDTAASRSAIIGAFTGPYTADAQKGDWALFTDGSGKLWWYEKNANGQYSSAKGTSIKTGNWVHVAITRSEGTVKYYVNGEEVATNTGNVVLNTASSKIPTLGYCEYGGENVNYLDGAIGDVRLWSTTKTQEEIQASMYKELTGTETGLMNYWKLDEQSGVNFKDSTSADNDGTIDVAWLENNQGLEFAGNQGVVAPLSKATGTIPQTVEAWVKIDTDTAASRSAIIGAFTGPYTADAQKGDWALFTDGSGKLWWYEKNANGQYSSAKGTSIKTGNWVHVAITRSEGTVKYYVNGEEVATNTGNVVLNTASSKIPTLGYCEYGGENVNYLDGALRDVRLWSTTRTADQIKTNMNTTLTGTEEGLMSYWKLDEQGGTTIKDSTKSGNNGTVLVGATWLPGIVSESQKTPEETYENEGYNFSQNNIWITSKELDVSPDNTIEAWVKIPKAVKSANVIAHNNILTRYQFSVTANGSPCLYWKDENGTKTEIVVNEANVCTGKWTHIAFVSDETAKTVTCYVNGIAVHVEENVALNDIVTKKIYVGNTFLGLIGDLRIWNKPLTEDEVKNSMSKTYTEAVEGLQLNVPFDEVNPTEFRDLSGNGNTIEIYKRILEWKDDTSEPGDFSIVVIPDQQVLSSRYPEYLDTIYQWIADNAEEENIKFAINLGDITDYNTEKEWNLSLEALDKIDELVPYSFIPGNHEYFIPGSYKYNNYGYRNLTEMNKYFGDIYDGLSTYGGSYDEGVENTWHEFEVYGHKYLVLALEYYPRDSVLEWASDVVEAHPDHQVIVSTHAYLEADGVRIATASDGFLYEEGKETPNTGKQVWEKFASQHENIIMVLCGHVVSDDVVPRIDEGVNGNKVVQMLINGQGIDGEQRGVGFLAMFRFSEDGENLEVTYFSPNHGENGENEYLNENILNFTLPAAVISEVDKTELEDLVKQAEKIAEDNYTTLSWNEFNSILTNAKTVLEDEKATHKDVEDANEALEEAIAGLEKGVTYLFEGAEEADDFTFYHSTEDTFEIKDGKLIPTGSEGEIKAIVNAGYRAYESVSVDIYPGEDGTINSGIYLGASKAGNADDQINALAILVQSNFVNTDGTWEDAPNRIDLIVTEYPWKELSRTISETGAGNALFTNGVKEPLHLDVDLEGDELTITLSLLSDPNKYVQVVYKYTGDYDLENGKVGLRSSISNNSFDNLNLVFEQLEIPVNKSELEEVLADAKKVKEDKYTSDSWKSFSESIKNAEAVIDDADATQDEVAAAVRALENAQKALKLKETYKTATYTFNSFWDTLDFDFYHSSNGGFIVKDGKLTSSGELGEFKAILRGDDRAYQSVSVDIYPGEDGNINSGLYINATGSGHAQDKINALSIMVESNFSGWDDAANRVDLVVGSFPTWKELSRTISETGAGNALFTDGKKEPLNLKVDIDGKEIAITVSLLSNPDVFVQTIYEYIGEGDLEHGAVGIRSLNVANSFDNFKVVYKTEIHSKDGNADTITNNTGVNTGDNMGTMMLLAVVMLMVSFGTILFVFDKKRKKLMQ